MTDVLSIDMDKRVLVLTDGQRVPITNTFANGEEIDFDDMEGYSNQGASVGVVAGPVLSGDLAGKWLSTQVDWVEVN